MITLSGDWLRAHWNALGRDGECPLLLSKWDDGDAFTLADLGPLPAALQVHGVVTSDSTNRRDREIVVRLTLVSDDQRNHTCRFFAPDGRTYAVTGRHEAPEGGRDMPVEIAEVHAALAERRNAIIESGLLSDATIFIAGVGTGGAHVALELAKAGVEKFIIVDDDRLTVGNVGRHNAGLSHAGRRKVHVVRDLLLEKNPNVSVAAVALRVEAAEDARVRDWLQRSTVVVCATDNRPSKLLINRLCVEESRTVVYGGAFRRAYGGQVFRVRPHRSPCYQCFVMAMPEDAADQEIARPIDAEAIAYSDRPVSIEPGLALDVAPISLMVARLVIQELVIGKPTTLQNMTRDFAAPWYRWMNRPEPGTAAADWPPLSESIDEMTIMRWYGIDFPRDEGCPVCGDFAAKARTDYGLDPSTPVEFVERPRRSTMGKRS
jgi:molybdopterin/thiamine biosynthesis adenylyltransferase